MHQSLRSGAILENEESHKPLVTNASSHPIYQRGRRSKVRRSKEETSFVDLEETLFLEEDLNVSVAPGREVLVMTPTPLAECRLRNHREINLCILHHPRVANQYLLPHPDQYILKVNDLGSTTNTPNQRIGKFRCYHVPLQESRAMETLGLP